MYLERGARGAREREGEGARERASTLQYIIDCAHVDTPAMSILQANGESGIKISLR